MGAKRRGGGGSTKGMKRKKTSADEDPGAGQMPSDAEPSSDEVQAGEDEDSEFFETADEKRLRLAKEYLRELGDSKPDSGAAGGDDFLQQKLEQDLQDQTRRSRKQVHNLQLGAGRFSRGHQYAATSVCLAADEATAFTGSKDCSIWRWDIESGKKDYLPGGRNRFDCGGHFQQVLGLCLVEQRHVLLSAGADRCLRMWDWRCPRGTACAEKLHEHNGAVTAVAAEPDGTQFYTASRDKSLKVWDIRSRRVLDTLLGHTSEVTCMDLYNKNRPVTGGADKIVRVWKVERDTHLMFSKHSYSVDAVTVSDSERFLSAGQDGTLALWSGASKRPLATASFGAGCWVSALSAIRGGNVVFSGSSDAKLRCWRFARGDGSKPSDANGKGGKPEELTLTQPLPALDAPGIINGIAVGKTMLACAVGKEHRLGRWFYNKTWKNGLWIVPLAYQEE